MELNEIFAKLKAHMLEGMVFHDEMARYYDFLNLPGYRECHKMHYESETEGYRRLCEYYTNHYNMLIPTAPMDRPDVIPQSWYEYKRTDVDAGTKSSAVKNADRRWVEWEKSTKDLYEDMCVELLNNGEIASSIFLMGYIADVDNEVKEACKNQITHETVGYDLSYIISEQ